MNLLDKVAKALEPFAHESGVGYEGEVVLDKTIEARKWLEGSR